ncbi:MAG: hypothetical protein PF637_02935 [Spirochaetes bacterium]|jgi:Skp family chaperone for outer membrane proteins|nr:hypothetical protein [Spirochaetota bacterium]
MKLKIITLILVLSAAVTLFAQQDTTDENPHWPMDIIFTNATNAAFVEPYNSEKNRIATDVQKTNQELVKQIDAKKSEFADLSSAKTPDRKKLIKCTKELYDLQIKLELANMNARKKIDDIDRQMIKDLTDKMENWSSDILKDDAKYQRFLEDIKKDK